MTNKLFGWALVLLVLVFGVAAILAYRRNHERALSIPTAPNLAMYLNDTYGYSFYYPPDYTVRVASEETIIIGMATSSTFDAYVEARIATTSTGSSYGDFVVATLKGLCQTLPGYRCADVAESSTYTTETNRSATKYYLNLTTPDGTKQRFGPLYVFNIGGNVTNASYASLIIYRPLSATSPLDALPAEDVAGKIDIRSIPHR